MTTPTNAGEGPYQVAPTKSGNIPNTYGVIDRAGIVCIRPSPCIAVMLDNLSELNAHLICDAMNHAHSAAAPPHLDPHAISAALGSTVVVPVEVVRECVEAMEHARAMTDAIADAIEEASGMGRSEFYRTESARLSGVLAALAPFAKEPA